MSVENNIPKGWVRTTLEKIVDCNPESIGRNFPFDELLYLDTGSIIKGKITSLQVFKLKEAPSRAKRIVQDKDIVYSTVRPNQEHYGFITEPEKNMIVSTGFTVIRSHSVYEKLLYYYLTQPTVTNYLHTIAEHSTTAYPSIKPIDLENLSFSYPKDINEQKAIANILTAFDDKIENLQAQNKTLEQTAQTIFKEWFGKYQVGDELPEGWRVGKLSEIAEFLNGLALQKYPPITGEETLPVIKIRELKQGITANTDKANTHLDKKYIIQNGDVLFSWSGSLEAIIWQNGNGALNQHLFKVSSEEFPKWFYYYWILHHLREFKGVAENKATTMGHINRKHLDLAGVIIPDEVSLNEHNRTFNPLINKLENNHQQIQTLKKTRDTLLPKLMSGALRVQLSEL